MPNQPHEGLSDKLVRDHLRHVTDKEAAWVFLQEPGFIGFGAVYRDRICLPPYIQQLDWERIRDLRLFGERGEWHVWQHWNGGWKSRLLELKDVCDSMTEYHILWGTWPPQLGPAPWVKMVETRGAEIWLPLAEMKLAKDDFPLRLKIKQAVDYDPKYHLAGIVDAALVGLFNKSCKKLLLPSDSLSSS